MWKNYDNAGAGSVTISGQQVSDLPAILADYAGLPDCEMFRIHRYIMSRIKADTRYYTIDSDNNLITQPAGDLREMMLDLKKVWYDLMRGRNLLGSVWDPIT